MPSPVTPSEILALVPTPTTRLADAMKHMMLDLNLLVYQWYSSLYNEDGSLTDAFARDICAVKAHC